MIKKVINKIEGLIEVKKSKIQTKPVLRQLESSNSVDVKKLVKAFNFFVNQETWTKEEIAAFDKINKLRRRYFTSTEIINLTDYGAGDSYASRTKEEMHEGVSKKISVSEVYKVASTPDKWGELIFNLIREFKPENCLELGTCLGVSAAYQISALRLNGKGRFITIEGSRELAQLADNNLKNLDCDNYTIHVGRFMEVLPNVLSINEPIDFAFIDGHHDKVATQEYYELLYPFLSEHAVVIFDDINWSEGMNEVWKYLYLNGQGIEVAFDLYKWGICVVNKNSTADQKQYYKVQL